MTRSAAVKSTCSGAGPAKGARRPDIGEIINANDLPARAKPPMAGLRQLLLDFFELVH
jgi:hypothetical protein